MTEVDTTRTENAVPSSMAHVLITLKYTFIEYFRARRFYIMLTISLVIGGLLTAAIGYFQPPGLVGSLGSPLSFYSSWWGLVTTFVIVLSGIFFGGDAISGEFQNKTGYFTLPNPIRRSSFYIGKWLAAFLASTIMLGISALIAMANELYYFGTSNFPYQFGEALVFSWIYLAAVLGFTFFFSSLFKGSTISILVSTILLLFGFSIIDTIVASFAKVEPWFVLTYGAGIIGDVLNQTYPDHIQTIQAGPNFSITLYSATIPEGLAIMFGYFVVTAILGLFLFERKEFN